MTMHEEWTDKLSEYLDGELPDAERRQVTAHLETCEDCSRILEELREVVAAANAAPPVEPSRDLWAGIAERIASPEGARPVVLSGPWRRFSFSLPQLAAASVLLAMVSGWAAIRFMPREVSRPPDVAVAPPPAQTGEVVLTAFSSNDAGYDAAVADLERTLLEQRARLDPETIKVVEDNLAIIDRAVSDARQALDEDPGNGYLSDYLSETRRRKLDLLRRATSLAEDLN